MGRNSKRRAAQLRNSKRASDVAMKNAERRRNKTENRLLNQAAREERLAEDAERLAAFTGRRIISCQSLLQGVEAATTHGRQCKRAKVVFNSEKKLGMATDVTFNCERCDWFLVIKSDSGSEQYKLNTAFAWGSASAPIGLDDSTKLLACLDIPPQTKHTFQAEQRRLTGDMKLAVMNNCLEVAAEERRLAVEAGDFVTVSGRQIPCIKVLVDGGWSTRTYGHGYDSNYGHAAAIGFRTKKVIDFDTRQKTCQVCNIATDNTDPPPHDCSKNWDKASTAMEADMIGEFFRQSIEKYDLVYTEFIGDGDSSVHAKVIDAYPGIKVQKIECINHAIKNVNKKLIALSGPSKVNQQQMQEERRIENMDKRFNEVGKCLRQASRHYNLLPRTDDNVEKLRAVINNLADHAFGNHAKCEECYCEQIGTVEDDWKSLSTTQMFMGVKKILIRPAQMARSFIENETSNIVECLMSVIAKYIEGKRKNLGGRDLHKLKIHSAVLAFNTTPFFAAAAYKILHSKEPNQSWKKTEQLALKRRKQTRNFHTKRSKRMKLATNFLKPKKGDKDYGDAPNRPDIQEEDLGKAVADLRSSLQVDEEQCRMIEEGTRDQASCKLWFAQRQNRITASNAGKIMKLNNHTQNTSTIKTLRGLYRFTGDARTWLNYGKDHEKVARRAFEVLHPEFGPVRECGLVVSRSNGIFAASPDGLVGNGGLLEIKCPYSIRDKDPNNWPFEKKSSTCPLEINKQTGSVSLKRKHDHFYQCVMNLIVSNADFIYYMIWTPVSSYIERIGRQEAEEVWRNMEPKLSRFWEEDYAPELVDSRLERSCQNCRQPPYRLEAIAKFNKVKESKKIEKERKQQEKQKKTAVAPDGDEVNLELEDLDLVIPESSEQAGMKRLRKLSVQEKKQQQKLAQEEKKQQKKLEREEKKRQLQTKKQEMKLERERKREEKKQLKMKKTARPAAPKSPDIV